MEKLTIKQLRKEMIDMVAQFVEVQTKVAEKAGKKLELSDGVLISLMAGFCAGLMLCGYSVKEMKGLQVSVFEELKIADLNKKS